MGHWIGIGLVLASVALGCQSAPTKSAEAPAPTPIAIQQGLQGLHGTTLSGENRTIEADRPTLLVFWQSWCGSCVEEAPEVERLHRRFGDRLQVLGVVSGPEGSVDEGHLQNTILRLGLSYPQIRDRDLRLTRLFEVKGTPDIVLLSGDQRVLYRAHHLPDSIDAFLQP